ncbi:MAG: DNA mismatch repair protein MutS [Planctomycetes bacterium]|nr:DNA mismatch repair protein MutS [Planctomycetota bacterium]
MEALTPAMQQYAAFKREHPDALLFFRMGDFYEMFFDDARAAAEALGIALTTRNHNTPNPVPMAGVPVRAVDAYLQRLIAKGFKVAICEQMEDPRQAQGLIRREVVRVVTPGTLTESAALDERADNHLAAWLPPRVEASGGGAGDRAPAGPAGPPASAGLAWVDLSTGRFLCLDLPAARATDLLARISPSELLTPADETGRAADPPAGAEGARVSPRPAWKFDREESRRVLLRHFKTRDLAGFGCDHLGPALGAAGAVLDYLLETQKSSLAHITRLEVHRVEQTMLLDAATRRCLELTETMRDGCREGSLLAVLDRAATAMGSRMLRRWLLEPLRDWAAIERRQGAVEEFLETPALRAEVRETLRRVGDMERIMARVATNRAGGRDLAALRQSLGSLPDLKRLTAGALSQALRGFHETLDPVAEVRDLLARAVADDPPPAAREGGVIRAGYSPELDDIRALERDGQGWLARFQAEEVARTGISTLKVGYNRVFGYYVEMSRLGSQKAPAHYVRKQTLKNAERYITPELKEHEEKVLSAGERGRLLEQELFQEVREQVARETPRVQHAAASVAALDAALSLAECAAAGGYVRPRFGDEPALRLLDARHPVVERTLVGEKFVPNDVILGGDKTLLIITGPNMAGKSTYIRQAALLQIMAQAGSFVPAREARTFVADRVFARIGSADDLARGDSTFMVEMVETANILNNATGRSLIVFDEVGRGTSTFDGVSIAWAVCEQLVSGPCQPLTLFATHYHELTELAAQSERVRNVSVAVREWGETVVFLRRIVEGPADKSYGIHVARLAGLPPAVLTRAREILAALEANAFDTAGRPALAVPVAGAATGKLRAGRRAPENQRRLFTIAPPGAG